MTMMMMMMMMMWENAKNCAEKEEEAFPSFDGFMARSSKVWWILSSRLTQARMDDQ